ncbi:DNA-binding response regulator, NarL/FixJ family, contains REC and HTH domains [Dyadobacter sp. SG02]|uniref:LuxR C-terminal-related transcriptional regulator n=1 Tax=Dyadobacter sp. SG02 TaxID=1855291 RepID=UPI0008B8CCC1|nr:response regulator transcription factor [Dyadobacter sp. SG02]SEJ38230.1 DNA-binding response regulator, NarL/FixJ family, contains REC and HTH domains [Dyadobacter sp. SG02]
MEVLLITDSPLIVSGLRSVILDTIHTTRFTETGSLTQTLMICHEKTFQLAFIDLAGLNATDLDLIAAIKKAAPDMIIWVNLRSDFTLMRLLLKGGVNGLFSSNSSSKEFRSALLDANIGKRFISEQVQEQLVSAVIGDLSFPALTARQEEVADLLAAGLSRRHIAEKIHVKPATVTHYRQIIFKKLGILSLKELRLKRKQTDPVN